LGVLSGLKAATHSSQAWSSQPARAAFVATLRIQMKTLEVRYGRNKIAEGAYAQPSTHERFRRLWFKIPNK